MVDNNNNNDVVSKLQDAEAHRRRRRLALLWTFGFFVLAAVGVTGLFVWRGNQNSNKNNTVIVPGSSNNDSNADGPQAPSSSGDVDLTPDDADVPAQEDNSIPEEKPEQPEDEEESVVDRDQDEEAASPPAAPQQPPCRHSTCASAMSLLAADGYDRFGNCGGGENDEIVTLANPTMEEAADQACQVAAEATMAHYYSITADSTGPMAITLHDPAQPTLISVLQGDSCSNDAPDANMICLGYDWNAMTWDVRQGERYTVMIHQVVGQVEWYFWTP